jgi:hypothetical protein
MKQRAEIAFSLLMLLVFAFAVYEARHWQLHARLLPWAVGFPMMLLALAQLTADWRRRPEKEPDSAHDRSGIPARIARQRAISMTLWLLGLFVAIWLLGFSPSIPLFTFFYLKCESQEGWPRAIFLSALSWLFLFGLFEWTLNIPFPRGELLEWFDPSES